MPVHKAMTYDVMPCRLKELAMIRTATMYIFFFNFKVQVASRAHQTASHDQQFACLFGIIYIQHFLYFV